MNLRAKPIQGYVTDSAGNIIRSATVMVREFTASSMYRDVDQVKTESSGAFTTKPLKPGTYDLFESGVLLSRIYHNFNNGMVPAFKASAKSGVPSLSLSSYGLDGGVPKPADINDYIYCIQVEGDDTDIKNNGHVFPIYAGLANLTGEAPFVGNGMTSASVVTCSRFNVEYYYPNVSSATFRFSNWRNVHAVSYGAGKPLVIPLTYKSLCINTGLPVASIAGTVTVGETGRCSIEILAGTGYENLKNVMAYSGIGKGDIVCVSVPGQADRYGIIFNDLAPGVASVYVWLQMWMKQHTAGSEFFAGAATLRFYHGFSSTNENAASSMSDRVTVFEDLSAEALI